MLAGDAGYSLIEVFLVVVILGIIASIAIPAYLGNREAAWVGQAETDLRNAAIELESFYAENDEQYPMNQAGFTALVTAGDVRVSQGTVRVGTSSRGITYSRQGPEAYCLTASHTSIDGSGATVVAAYDSNGGGLVSPPSEDCS